MLSVVILTRNEAEHIEACLESARPFADERIVFDSRSEDATRELARRAGATVYERPFDNWPCQRNAAIEGARGDWIFFLDADERADPPLGQELREVMARAEAGPEGEVLFWVPRRNYILNRWIKHAGWSPDYQPRLLKKGRARFDPARPVHELVIADGREGYLVHPLTHYNYRTLKQFRTKQSAYARFEAQELLMRGDPARLRGLVGQPLREFYRRFVTLQGYREGAMGLLLCALMAYYAFVRQRLFLQMWNKRNA